MNTAQSYKVNQDYSGQRNVLVPTRMYSRNTLLNAMHIKSKRYLGVDNDRCVLTFYPERMPNHFDAQYEMPFTLITNCTTDLSKADLHKYYLNISSKQGMLQFKFTYFYDINIIVQAIRNIKHMDRKFYTENAEYDRVHGIYQGTANQVTRDRSDSVSSDDQKEFKDVDKDEHHKREKSHSNEHHKVLGVHHKREKSRSISRDHKDKHEHHKREKSHSNDKHEHHKREKSHSNDKHEHHKREKSHSNDKHEHHKREKSHSNDKHEHHKLELVHRRQVSRSISRSSAASSYNSSLSSSEIDDQRKADTKHDYKKAKTEAKKEYKEKKEYIKDHHAEIKKQKSQESDEVDKHYGKRLVHVTKEKKYEKDEAKDEFKVKKDAIEETRYRADLDKTVNKNAYKTEKERINNEYKMRIAEAKINYKFEKKSDIDLAKRHYNHERHAAKHQRDSHLEHNSKVYGHIKESIQVQEKLDKDTTKEQKKHNKEEYKEKRNEIGSEFKEEVEEIHGEHKEIKNHIDYEKKKADLYKMEELNNAKLDNRDDFRHAEEINQART
jgi:hypothetical protein